jgi:hypothetical protein
MEITATKKGKVKRISEEEYAAYINFLKNEDAGESERKEEEEKRTEETGG